MTIQTKSYNEKESISRFEDGLNKRPKEDYKRKPKNTKQLHSWFYEDEDDEEYYEQYYTDNSNET